MASSELDDLDEGDDCQECRGNMRKSGWRNVTCKSNSSNTKPTKNPQIEKELTRHLFEIVQDLKKSGESSVSRFKEHDALISWAKFPNMPFEGKATRTGE